MPRMPRGRPRKALDPKTIEAAADLAKSYAEHWERQTAQTARPRRRPTDDDYWDAKTKAGHWRIIEKAIRGLAGKRA
jgi:hypothetical protein